MLLSSVGGGVGYVNRALRAFDRNVVIFSRGRGLIRTRALRALDRNSVVFSRGRGRIRNSHHGVQPVLSADTFARSADGWMNGWMAQGAGRGGVRGVRILTPAPGLCTGRCAAAA
eukprot:gene24799-biopygen20921